MENAPFIRQDVHFADLVLSWYIMTGYQNLTPVLILTLVSMAAVLTKDP